MSIVCEYRYLSLSVDKSGVHITRSQAYGADSPARGVSPREPM
jgi:hypothetical protein